MRQQLVLSLSVAAWHRDLAIVDQPVEAPVDEVFILLLLLLLLKEI